ncbi:hypothetical protein B0H13DRAFT_864651 [Mycena leptocephala]|nr:hypothetical protein B0H13DRAFT_864651 [Mycena leptocephala]
MIQTCPTLANLQSNLRGKNSFSHIQHPFKLSGGKSLLSLLSPRGVGSRGFSEPDRVAQFFYLRAQSILEVTAKLSYPPRTLSSFHSPYSARSALLSLSTPSMFASLSLYAPTTLL